MNEPKDTTLNQALEHLDLTENAKQLYLGLYKRGQTTIGDISQQLGMDRSSAYNAFEQLKEVGIGESQADSRPMKIWAKSPKVVLGKLENEIHKLEIQFDDLHEQMPQLLAGFESEEKRPTLQFFSGQEGLKQIVEDVLSVDEGGILLFTNQHFERSIFSESEHRRFINLRQQRGVFIRAIATDSPEAKQLQKADADNQRKTKILTDQEAPFRCETYIYGDKVAMIDSITDIVGFTVRSQEFARFQRWLFENLWSQL